LRVARPGLAPDRTPRPGKPRVGVFSKREGNIKVAAPPKYTDEQRAAIFTLHQMGMNSVQISAQCRLGTAGAAPFDVPERTALDIAKKMEAEHARAAASTANPNDLIAMAEGMSDRVLQILDVRLKQLERKAAGSNHLSTDDIKALAEIPKIQRAVVTSLKKLPRPGRGNRKPRSKSSGNGKVVSLVDRLALEMREEKAGGEAVD
jgi:hypothetical protein